LRGDDERLRDILEAIEAIERHLSLGEERFRGDELLQVWALHHLQLIGEAAAGLSEAAQSELSEVPWAAVVGMRKILVHEYFGMDLDRVWATVERDLPELKQVLSRHLED